MFQFYHGDTTEAPDVWWLADFIANDPIYPNLFSSPYKVGKVVLYSVTAKAIIIAHYYKEYTFN